MLRNITDKLPFTSAMGQKSLLAHMRSICTKQWTTEFFFLFLFFTFLLFPTKKTKVTRHFSLWSPSYQDCKKVGRGEEQSRGLSIHCTLKCEFCCILVIQSKTGENVSRRKPNHVRLTKNVLRFTFKGSEYFRGSSRSLKRAVHTSKTTAYCQFSL